MCISDGYAEGDTITYGSLGTSGTLATGDAFDCDVNGDGTYDSSTERFYYVSDYYDTSTNEYNSEYATLIYYNNVSGGVADNTTGCAYSASSAEYYYGPQAAISQLPTTTQWSNVSLVSTARNIIDFEGIVRVTDFSYEGYTARLLTYQEVESGCYDGTTSLVVHGGLRSKCKFLSENTRYSTPSAKTNGYWLEKPFASNIVGYIQGSDLFIGQSDAISSNFSAQIAGVRPAIEVAKTNILY